MYRIHIHTYFGDICKFSFARVIESTSNNFENKVLEKKIIHIQIKKQLVKGRLMKKSATYVN